MFDFLEENFIGSVFGDMVGHFVKLHVKIYLLDGHMKFPMKLFEYLFVTFFFFFSYSYAEL